MSAEHMESALRTMVLLSFLLAGGCDSGPAKSPEELRAVVAAHLPQIKTVPLKYGVPSDDPHFDAILTEGTAVAPYLAEQVLDDRESHVFEYFQYRRGDVAHALLQHIYEDSPAWPPDEEPPIGGHPTPTFMDHKASVNRPGGREALAQRWRAFIESRSRAEDA